MKRLTWAEDTRTYSSGVIGNLGKWKVFSIHWDAFRSRNSDTPPYVLNCSLPGIKANLGNFEDIEEGKIKAEKVLQHWLEKSTLLDEK